MNRNDLFESIGQVDDALLEKSEKKKHHLRPLWISTVAAVLILVLGVGWFFSSHLAMGVRAVAVAHYPIPEPYPTGGPDADGFDEQYEKWWEYNQAHCPEPGYADNLRGFFDASMGQFLSHGEGNAVYSPLNTYMALAMLAELTEGESRQQVLNLLGSDSIEALRTQANTLWNAQYEFDGATTSILASSLWMSDSLDYNKQTMKLLADNYYATPYVGPMGTEIMDDALHSWLNAATGNLLRDQVSGLHLDAETLLALAATLRFEARWLEEFNPDQTQSGVFHAPDGDAEVPFMHRENTMNYFWGDGFGAVGLELNNGAGTMWLILPDEGVTPEELAGNQEVMDFLAAGYRWENQEYLIVNMAVPRFDVTGEVDLREGLQALGVTDVFDPEIADFSPMLTEPREVFLSQAKQAVRVTVDEEGVAAASYTVMMMEGAGRPPEKTVDFTLDRPFLFAVTSGDQLPLFAGIVNHP